MWKVLAKSVQGSSHKRVDSVCQDACQVADYLKEESAILVLTASDGAGSAEHSDVGSQLACQVVHRIVNERLQQSPELFAVSRDDAIGWYEQVRSELQQEADARAVPVRQLACTLLIAVVTDSGAAFCQVGDGAIVIRDQEGLRPVFWPQSGEYANTTNFVTSCRLEQDLMFEWHEGAIEELSLFTDGLQSLALNYATKQAHQPFFTPLLETLRKHPNPEELLGPMQAFLESKNVTDRTDDDLTLILATRIPAV